MAYRLAFRFGGILFHGLDQLIGEARTASTTTHCTTSDTAFTLECEHIPGIQHIYDSFLYFQWAALLLAASRSILHLKDVKFVYLKPFADWPYLHSGSLVSSTHSPHAPSVAVLKIVEERWSLVGDIEGVITYLWGHWYQCYWQLQLPLREQGVESVSSGLYFG